MAKIKGNTKEGALATDTAAGGKKKAKGILFGIALFLLALIVVVGIVTGVFYIIIRNNVNGFADKYREQIKNIPVLGYALPAPPADYDPLDPENLSRKELLTKYNEFRSQNNKLLGQMLEVEEDLETLELLRSANEELKHQNKEMEESMQRENSKLQEEIERMEELLVREDKEGFKEFFEKMNKEKAEEVYSHILEEQKLDEQSKQFAQIYEKMDASAAAQIFEELVENQPELVVGILKNMKKDSAAQIIEEMTGSSAAKITKILSKEFGFEEYQ